MNRWLIPEPRPVAALEALGDLPLLGRQVLAARGLDQAAAVRAFLAREDPGHDPFSLPGMPAAVDRVLQAVEGGEKVAVYGDYDADGITATAILCLGLRALGLAPVAHLPDRFAEGYGLRAEALSLLGGQGVSLVITVDCGVRSV
ncbi:MAG: DHH family phosphoesterase, partial [Anaerolineales bacterium]|nr:DHH family phosphoesterase [Anaerolineales bacterium]